MSSESRMLTKKNRPRLIFVCQHISSDENRAQFNRVRFLCEHYCLYIIANGPVSSEACKNAKTVFFPPFGKKKFSFFSFIWGLWKVLQIVRKENIKQIYSTYEPRTIFLAHITAKLLKMTWILDLWDDPEKGVLITKQRPGALNRLIVFAKKVEFNLVKPCLKSADKIIIGLVPDRVIEKYSLCSSKILTITNGINLQYDFQRQIGNRNINNERFTIFYCGTVDRIRMEGLKDCVKIVLGQLADLKIIVIGREETGGYSWLKDQLKDLGNRLILEVKGRQPYKKVIDAIDESDICICPYPDKLDITATYPVKIFDYMMMGKPVVASSLTGISRILTHGVDSLLFRPGRYDEMADCIINLYNSKPLRQKLSRNAKKNVLKYSWDSIHEKIYEFL